MTGTTARSAVVVGIDGSSAAVHAAEWAAAEAVSRDIPLRLVYAVRPGDPSWPLVDEAEPSYAEKTLTAAQVALEATGRPVKIETEVHLGRPVEVLGAAAQDAALLAVGSTGIGNVASRLLGSTAAELARTAPCSVAVIRSGADDPDDTRAARSIAVIVTADRDADAVIDAAAAEARLRGRSIIIPQARPQLITEWIATWRARHSDLQITTAPVETSVNNFLALHRSSIDLVVFGAALADGTAEVVGPHGHGLLQHARRSVLVVR